MSRLPAETNSSLIKHVYCFLCFFLCIAAQTHTPNVQYGSVCNRDIFLSLDSGRKWRHDVNSLQKKCIQRYSLTDWIAGDVKDLLNVKGHCLRLLVPLWCGMEQIVAPSLKEGCELIQPTQHNTMHRALKVHVVNTCTFKALFLLHLDKDLVLYFDQSLLLSICWVGAALCPQHFT